MRILVLIASVLLFSANGSAASDISCGGHASCPNAACCKHDTAHTAFELTEPIEVGVMPAGFEWPAEVSEKPTREYAKVLFRDPVRIGERILIGAYVIEHDTDRMARGLPCTHIYAADDLRIPVVAFHCRHLDRKAAVKPTVTLRRLPDPSTRMFQLLEYQFAGSAHGHGVPNAR